MEPFQNLFLKVFTAIFRVSEYTRKILVISFLSLSAEMTKKVITKQQESHLLLCNIYLTQTGTFFVCICTISLAKFLFIIKTQLSFLYGNHYLNDP